MADELSGSQLLLAALKSVLTNPRQTAMDAWQAPQNLLGLAQGISKTGALPTHSLDSEGNAEFRFDTPGKDPLTVGAAISADKGILPEDLAHERVHTEQSRRYGPAYIPMRVLGDLMGKVDTPDDPYLSHPMEDEAYLRTAPTAKLATRLSLKKAYQR